jgi:non-ribosomal peptide synthetase component F
MEHPPELDGDRPWQDLTQGSQVDAATPFEPRTPATFEQSIPARFEQQVERYPAHLAVKSHSDTLTYAALNHTANRVAHAILARRGLGAEPIALLLEPGAPVLAAILGRN